MARPRVHDDALRTRMIERAAAIIAERGAAGLSLRRLADESGTSTSAVYALFGNRDGLVRAVAEEAFRRFAAHLAAVEQTEDPLADMLTLGVAYRASALAEPFFYQVMFDSGPARVPVGDVAAQPAFAVLRAAVRRCQDAGLLPAQPPAEAMAFSIWGHVHGLVALELAGLMPGTPQEREAGYVAALRAAGAGQAVLAAMPPGGPTPPRSPG